MKRFASVGALAAVLALTAIAVSGPAVAAPNDVTVVVPDRTPTPTPTIDVPDVEENGNIVNAQLRWGLNIEAGAKAYAPGTCNFLSAGTAGDTRGSRTWTAADGFYKAHDGLVRIEKPNANGVWQLASFDSRCTDPRGANLSTTVDGASGNQVVMDGGVGSRTNGALQIQWRGSFTVAFYSGMTYWSVTDPALSVDASGSGRLTATASGFGADMNDTETWSPITARPIVLAEIRGAGVSDPTGFTVVPEYLGVAVATSETAQVREGENWGSFPQSFVDFHSLTGQNSYWYSSGGAADRRKPATALYISYDAAVPVAVPAPGTSTADATGAPPSNPVRRPPVGAAIPVPAVASAATLPVSVNASVTTLPATAGLVPTVASVLSPLVLPLLGTAAALGLSVIAVLGLMQALPWQRRVPVP